ncbi:hypothetical protein ABIE18_003662 [Arthrobacter sp. 2762]
MTGQIAAACSARAKAIARSLTRHRLVFVQVGAAFEPLRAGILDGLRGVNVSVGQRSDWKELGADANTVLVTDLEQCVETAAEVLGEVRELVFQLLDEGKAVCLISRAPRLSFRSVPGSSILEDAALVTLPLLDVSELSLASGEYPPAGCLWPSVAFGSPISVDTFRDVLAEAGQGTIAALDHALYEVSPKSVEGLEFLAAREVEALRGAGILLIDEGGRPALALPRQVKELREALAGHVSETVAPANSLAEVTSGLWYIERRIRNAVRASAMTKFSSGWRSSIVGGLKDEILRRAQLDSVVTAKSVSDLRDPLEWLTLGELMDIVKSDRCNNLGLGSAVWRKFQEQVLPIRNRLAHVRILKADDAEIITMWASLIRQRVQ